MVRVVNTRRLQQAATQTRKHVPCEAASFATEEPRCRPGGTARCGAARTLCVRDAMWKVRMEGSGGSGKGRQGAAYPRLRARQPCVVHDRPAPVAAVRAEARMLRGEPYTLRFSHSQNAQIHVWVLLKRGDPAPWYALFPDHPSAFRPAPTPHRPEPNGANTYPLAWRRGGSKMEAVIATDSYSM